MVLIFISLMSNDKYLYLSIFFVNCLCKLFHSFLIDCLSFYYLVKRVLYKLRISILFQMFCKYFLLIYGLPIYFLNGITYQQKLLILTGRDKFFSFSVMFIAFCGLFVCQIFAYLQVTKIFSYIFSKSFMMLYLTLQ